MPNNFIDAFNEYFEIVPAVSDELKYEVYKLRYQVFCIENKIFNSDNYPNKLEFDDYDQHSVHYLIRHRNSEEYAATTRLILPDTNNLKKLFPLELHCEIDNLAVVQSINREQMGEVSRFGVSKTFKRRKNEKHSLIGANSDFLANLTPSESRSFPLITLGLMACIIKASHENGIHYLYAGTEQSLLRFLSGLGIHFIKIGPLADFHGKRWPCLIKIAHLLENVAEKNMHTWNFLTNKGQFVKPSIKKQAHPEGIIPLMRIILIIRQLKHQIARVSAT